jgi:hypothetical protein
MLVSFKVMAATTLSGLMGQFEWLEEKIRAITGGIAGVTDVLKILSNPSGAMKFFVEKRAEQAAKGAPAPPTSDGITTTTTTTTGKLPGLEAAVGFAASSPQIPGLAFAAPQSGALSRAAAEKTAAERFASTGSKFDKEQLEAMKRNNEILEKLAAY